MAQSVHHGGMMTLSAVCVYCGSNSGASPLYLQAATALGRALAHADISLVYGGGSVGLMGAVAQAALEANGHVVGIIPDFLKSREVMLQNVSDLIVTETMHERKHVMFEKADAFVALPGGIGTLEEVVEQMTWSQLGQHAKPIVLLNINGFWDPLITLLEHMRSERFINPERDVAFTVVERAEDVVTAIRHAITPLEPGELAGASQTIEQM